MPLGSSSCERPPGPLPQSVHQNRYHELRAQLLPASQLPKLPWQGPNLLGGLLTGGPRCKTMAPFVLPDLRVVPKVAAYVAQQAFYSRCSVAELRPAKFRKLGECEEDAAKKLRLVRKWQLLISNRFAHTALAQTLGESDNAVGSLSHTLGNKSSSTLAVRLSAVNGIIKWLEKHIGEFRCFTENDVYAFAKAWHRHPTTVSSAISGLNLLGGLLPDQSILDIAGSWRIQGAASEKVSAMPARKQAATLTPAEIQMLETLVCNNKSEFYSRQRAWVFLVLTALRSRYGDMHDIVSMQDDGDLLEVVPSKTKMSHRDKSRLNMSMLGPLKLFSRLPWHDAHVKEREKHGMPIDTWQFAPAYNGRSFVNRSCKSSDYNKALQSLLRELQIPQADRVTGHSAKASMLTFAGSRGFKSQTLSILAYHSVPCQSKSTRAYDRGRLLEPVKAFQFIVDEYSAASGCADDGAVSDVESACQSGSSDSGSSSSSSSDGAESETIADNTFILNEKTGAVHKGNFNDENRSACGIPLLAHYRTCSVVEMKSMNLCGRGCFPS